MFKIKLSVCYYVHLKFFNELLTFKLWKCVLESVTQYISILRNLDTSSYFPIFQLASAYVKL